MAELWIKVDASELGYDMHIPMQFVDKAAGANIFLMVCSMVHNQYQVTRTMTVNNCRFDVEDGDYVTITDLETSEFPMDKKVCHGFLKADTYFMFRDYTAPAVTFH